MNNTYIVVTIDQYAGNWDSFLCGLLFDYDDDRFGAADGILCREGMNLPRKARYIENIEHPDSQWNNVYNMPDNDLNTLEFCVEGQAAEYTQILSAAFKGKTCYHENTKVVITGFAVKTDTITTVTNIIEF